jgi:hypothetical protein
VNTKYSTLGRMEIFRIVANLDEALGVLNRQPVERSTSLDVHFRSLLTTLKRELVDDTEPLYSNDELPSSQSEFLKTR